MSRYFEDWEHVCEDLVNYGNLPEARVLAIIKILVDLNDDIAHIRHVRFIHGYTDKIRAILDEIDANPEGQLGILNPGGAA